MIALRAMQQADLDAVLAIEQAAYEFPWTRGHFVDSLAAGYSMQVLPVEGGCEGYFVAMPGVEEMHLLNITVAPPRQGQGLAQAMLQALARHARSRGARQLWLEVRASNQRARRLYAYLGFEQVGLRKAYYPAQEGREDALVMRLMLAPTGGDDALE
jgi:[ribosomal protein S18]-alanine N-acetyltransferase